MKYPVVIHKDKNSDYGVTFPDIEGCFSAGETVEKALLNAKEAAECHIEGMKLDGESIPAPASIEAHRLNPDYKDGIWAIIEVDLEGLPSLETTEKVSIVMTRNFLDSLDCFVEQHGTTRSAILTQAATKYINSYQ